MTLEPDRDPRAPAGIDPDRRLYSREGAGLSVALMLGILAAFVAVGIWFYAGHDDPAVATDNRPAQERSTTGAGSATQPQPQTPAPPVAPPQPRQ